MRLQKYIANAGVCSRRSAEDLIVAGKVKVNGAIVNTLGSKINPEQDRVEVENKLIQIDKNNLIYIALHKPTGYSTTLRRSQYERRIISDLLIDKNFIGEKPLELPRVFPIGRLDKDTSGLLLLSNDGDLHTTLTHPKHKIEKEYEVSCRYAVSDEMLKDLEKGIIIDGKKTSPAKASRTGEKTFRFVISEGRNRQIRRMCNRVKNPVEKLHRIRVGRLEIGDLPEGKWKSITISELKKATAH